MLLAAPLSSLLPPQLRSLPASASLGAWPTALPCPCEPEDEDSPLSALTVTLPPSLLSDALPLVLMVTLSSSLPLAPALLGPLPVLVELPLVLGALLDEVLLVPDALELPDLFALLEPVFGVLPDEVVPDEPDELFGLLVLLALGELLEALLPLVSAPVELLLCLDSSTGSASTVSIGLSEG